MNKNLGAKYCNLKIQNKFLNLTCLFFFFFVNKSSIIYQSSMQITKFRIFLKKKTMKITLLNIITIVIAVKSLFISHVVYMAPE